MLLLAGASSALGSRPATELTRQHQQAVSPALLAQGAQALEDARRGFMASLRDPVIRRADGHVVWDMNAYRFIDEARATPDTVHPALWQQARINNLHGLFRVTDRIYQVRGYDVDNLTIVEGTTGLILIDPMTFPESARASLDLYFEHRPRRPVVAVIYSHSHADHFGGVRGVVDEAAVRAGAVTVWAPQGFMEEAIGENVAAGNAMARRADYQFGIKLPRSERGQVDVGLGKTVGAGQITLIPPTHLVREARETHVIDGVEVEFTLTPESEAPAEMILYFPQWRVLNIAELACQTFHNLLPLRGARVRDARLWSAYLNDALYRYGDRSDVMVAQHNWPVWGGEPVRRHLALQRDTYKFVHDQTLRLMNHGYKAAEIAEAIRLPRSLEESWGVQPFYGSVKHNVKAVYQRYLGWYDGNPATLDPLPPEPAARKAVEYMGGADEVLRRARADYARGEYRWVAQVASQLVFADPGNRAARELAADAFEQLGYQAQSGTWRSAYLQGALELRQGVASAVGTTTASPDMVRALPSQDYFDYLAIRVVPERAEGLRIALNWIFPDSGEAFVVDLENGALSALRGAERPEADATVTMSRATLDRIALGQLDLQEAIDRGDIRVTGPRPAALGELLGLFETFPTHFNIVEPLRAPAAR
jgi:alkyl sulfatase BDS1-like metallo-beta-lactamase superfamily hydrolase